MGTTMALAARRTTIFGMALVLIAALLTVVPSSPAQASHDHGSIVGTVESVSGDVPRCLTVDAWQWEPQAGQFYGQATQNIADDGHFALSLPAGDYALYFSVWCGRDQRVQPEWWRDAPDMNSADLVTVSAGVETTGIDVTMAIGATVSGTVTSAVDGSGVEGSRVTAVYEDGAEFTTTTDASGRYTFADLVPGTLTVRVEAPEGSGLVSQWWEGADRASARWFSIIDGGGLQGVNVALPQPTVMAAAPTIAGAAAVGETLYAAPGEWQEGATLTYRWLADGSPIAGGTGASLLLGTAQRDRAISVEVTGSIPGHVPAIVTSDPTPKVATAATPTITGNPWIGGTLTAAPGAWTTGTTFTYQWLADGTPIAGATKPTFAPTAAQESAALTVAVTGSKAGYATITKESAATLRVARFAVPSVSGTLAVGYTLTAQPNTWTSGATFAYQWYANGVALSGATKATLTLTSAHRDKQISVRVTGSQTGYRTINATSPKSARVTSTATPTISGVKMVGSTLAAAPGSWLSGTTFTYQWYADGSPISGATRSTLVLATAHRDKAISVTVTGRKTGYATVSRNSAKTTLIATTAVPRVSGQVMVGGTMTATPGAWTAGTTFTYQWYASGKAVSGATGKTFRPGKSYVGKTISVRVVGANGGYQTIARTSAATVGVRSGKAWPATRDNCPSGYPIKGNQTTRHTTDWIYHVPGGRYYAVTDPEECFATTTAAAAWGYRASMQ